MLDITIATRESRLAWWQAEHVRDRLTNELGAQVRLLGMTTRGDQILDRSLSKVGGKGLFVKELEAALAEHRADLAVHSLKDVPMELPDGFALAAVLEREDPRDAFVCPRHASLEALPKGARVGTSSLRRLVQLLALRPDLMIEPLRGNLDTRLRKLDEGHYDAIVLAAAGLRRLGLASRIAALFEPAQMLPAAGQGALAIEVRSADAALQGALRALVHRPTWLAVAAERAVSRHLGGSCSMPLAAHARFDGEQLVVSAALGHAHDAHRPLLHAQVRAVLGEASDGAHVAARTRDHAEASARLTADAERDERDDACARTLGESVAAALLRQPAADEYLAAATAS